MEAEIEANAVIIDYLEKGQSEGRTLYALRGGRRSGKTFNIMIWLIGKAAIGDTIITATMTDDAGTKGAYADAKEILRLWGVEPCFHVLSSPKEIRATSRAEDGRQGVIYFKSYADPESAKGGACDWVFINEANKFTYQQYLDLAANARKGVICDYNPNEHFWIEDECKERGVVELVTTWQDNRRHLTANQIEYFENLKRKAEAPTATDIDRYYYRVYYLGEYAEIGGEIFTPYNLHFVDDEPKQYRHVAIFCDPSALRGADYFACCLSAVGADNNVYILDTYSTNEGTREQIVLKLLEWCKAYDVAEVFVETNGIIGIDFFEFARNSFSPYGVTLRAWNSRVNKFERIVANFQNLTTRLFICRKPLTGEYMKQVYEFSKKCEHDDNIDALNSSFSMQQFRCNLRV